MSGRGTNLEDTSVCGFLEIQEREYQRNKKIIADLKKLEEKYITKEQFYLPDVIRQGRLLPADNESQIPAILFLGIAVIVFLFGTTRMKSIRNKKLQTRDQSVQEYPHHHYTIDVSFLEQE